MSETFLEIKVTKFTAGPNDQDSEKPGLFRFQFLLSRSAPDLWVRVASMDLGDGGRPHFCIQRYAWAYSDRIVVRCAPEEAQRIKDSLNRDVLPSVTQTYLRAAEAARAKSEAANHEQQKIMKGVQDAIRNQQ
jgi:hypothetical protein